MPTRYDDILRNVESLSWIEQLRLISEVAEYLRTHAAPETRTTILDLQGLGKELWRGIDAQQYADGERISWNA